MMANRLIYKPELIFRIVVLSASSFAILMSFALTVGPDEKVYFPLFEQPLRETCSSRILFGMDCPGCGMSRAFISISDGSIKRALQFNSASLIVYLFVAAQIPWHAFQIYRTFQPRGPIDTWWTLVPPIGVIAWMLVCYFNR